ncbi:hypothetical protein ACGF07_32920 [Kitasatospora sp. NPDC048194]|uniref:hypothetical protein n=1 Tax=Kitasatospora sp. NPDC048194 TaxID=3364045 RepID=UPI003721D0C9
MTQAEAVEPAEPSRPGRTAYRRESANPNGSTTALRADVLGALGVLKAATADQLQRLLRPQAASNTVIRQALRDLALHGLVASDGNTRDRHKTWRLESTAGLEAAGHVVGVPRADMGSTARGAGCGAFDREARSRPPGGALAALAVCWGADARIQWAPQRSYANRGSFRAPGGEGAVSRRPAGGRMKRGLWRCLPAE